ncbi:MAG: hypothetical protein RJA22_3341 [Verrucomicrobiota bacterium]
MNPPARLAAAATAALGLVLALARPTPAVPPAAPGPSARTTNPPPHWAFQPVRQPAVKAPRGVHPIDALLGTAQAPPADPRTLLRRLTYDLTGLPPSPAEVEAFVRACGPRGRDRAGAIRQAIDRLLASPAYGEKWGRKWLDVARYADTAGENTDHPVPHAWRYRNYVIEAFNQDLPYDQFLREQLAGDLLPDATPDRHAERIAATGYLAVARRFGHETDQDMHLTYEDVIDTLGKSVLGLSLGCARCHAHKHDPVSSADYYALYGIFASTRFAYPGCEATPRARDFVPLWSTNEIAARRQPFLSALAEVDATLNRLGADLTNTWRPLRQALTNAPRTRLAGGEFHDGGRQSFPTNGQPLTITVKAGELLQLTVFPRANFGADTTLLEWSIEETGGARRRWDLAGDAVAADFLAANPLPDRQGHPATWALLDARPRLHLLRQPDRHHIGKAGLHAWKHGGNPIALVNTTDQPIKAWTTLPPRSVFVHPAPDGPVAVAWISPLDGEVRLQGRVIDAHPGGGDGVGWALEHVAVQAGPGMRSMAEAMRGLQEPGRRRAELAAREPVVPVAYAVRDGRATNAPLQKRGEPGQPGEIIPRGNLALLGGDPVTATHGSGRLELAAWLTRPTNPLTARVMANRIWQGHFNRGLVATPSDFGTHGAPPTHPALLDWLAATFMEQGWSVKALHRVILASAAYQQASAPGGTAARPPGPGRRRLEAEELRDTLLLLSGELDPTPGEGHPFPAPGTAFTQHNPFKAVYDSKKRSVYLMTQRIQRHPFLTLFDGPDTNASTAERGSSTVPTQALYFLNDPFFHARSEAFARRVLAAASTREARVTAAHQLCFQRDATAAEQAQARAFLESVTPEFARLPAAQQEPAAWSTYARTLLAANELLHVE